MAKDTAKKQGQLFEVWVSLSRLLDSLAELVTAAEEIIRSEYANKS